MSRFTNIIVIAIFFIFALFSSGFCAEQLTITTYYPSPYGAYTELYVNDSLGIGTTDPQAKLEIKNSLTGSAGAHADQPILRITQGADTAYNIGDIHGELQFYTDDPGGNFPAIQAYIRSVTTRGNGITNPDTGLFFGTGTGGTDGGAADRMVINHLGYVGIGTTTPSFGLDVRGASGWIGSGDSSQSLGGWRLGLSPGSAANTWVYLYRADSSVLQDLAVGALWAGGALRYGTADDIAEMTPVKAEDNLEPGDVVVIAEPPDDRALLAKSRIPYDSKIAGVISNPETAALIIGGSHPTDVNRNDLKPLALSGRVLTKVTTENGAIRIGDPLTSSSKPGIAMKATKSGWILGRAMQPFAQTTDKAEMGNIWVLVNVRWYGGASE
jgi:hypothetical protein